MRVILIVLLLISFPVTAKQADIEQLLTLSSCGDATTSLKRTGAEFIKSEPNALFKGLDVVDHEFSGWLFEQPVKIFITCLSKSKLMLIGYEATPSPASGQSAKSWYLNAEIKISQLLGGTKKDIIYHRSAYDQNHVLKKTASPWRHVSSWCNSGVSISAMAQIWSEPGLEQYFAGITFDYNSIGC